jgi:RecA/RadA recombinase
MSILEKIKKNSTIKDASILSKSQFFDAKDMIQTSVPAMNIILSGEIDGGFVPGLTMWAGPSKHFKSLFSLIMVKAYMEKYPDSACVFYDSEFGSPKAYFESLKIDQDRILHSPIADLENLRSDVTNQLEGIERGEKVIFWIDSIGNAASKKEVQDAVDEKSVADMTRAKTIKSLFRIIGPRLTIKDVPLIAVNHTYMEIGMFPKQIVGGGTGSYYNADNIFILGRQTEREGTETTGYNFVINVEKSRMVKERSKIAVEVSFNKGINKWSGLLDIALNGGFVIKPKNGWYQVAPMHVVAPGIENPEKSYREAETHTSEFWTPFLNYEPFKNHVKNTYKLSENDLLGV